MSALEVLERTARLDQHLASHAYAERLYEHVVDLIDSGVGLTEVREAIRELHRRARENHQVVERDAFVEVLALSTQSFLPVRHNAPPSPGRRIETSL